MYLETGHTGTMPKSEKKKPVGVQTIEENLQTKDMNHTDVVSSENGLHLPKTRKHGTKKETTDSMLIY